MNPPPDRDELFRLFGGLSNETLTDAEHARLEEVLTRSPEARQLWFLFCDLERGLARRSATPKPVPAKIVPLRPTARPAMKWAWAMAASVAFVALLGALMFVSSGTASAAAVVRQALKAHSAMLDRCYRVNGEWDSPVRESRLWTRGDRFWMRVRAFDKVAAWGRDESGRVWFTASPTAGGWFEADEVPERLAQVCELRSLQPESLLRSLLTDFDLRREPDAGGNHLIHAELKPGREHPRYHAALLEIDSTSGVLRRVVVHRVVPNRSPVPVTFTLIESGLLDDASYTLAGHLPAEARIFDRHSPPGQRTRVLAEFLQVLTGRDRTHR